MVSEFKKYPKIRALGHEENEGILDGFITIEEKYIPQYSIENYLNFIVLSNYERVAYVDQKERRYFILRATLKDELKNPESNRSYFIKLLDETDWKSWIWYLKYSVKLIDIDGREFEPRHQFFSTEELQNHKRTTLGSIPRFVLSGLDYGKITRDQSYKLNESTKILMSDYLDEFKETINSRWMDALQFYQKLVYIFGSNITKIVEKRVSYLIFPSLQKGREAWRNYVNDPEWKFIEENFSEKPNEDTDDDEFDSDGNLYL